MLSRTAARLAMVIVVGATLAACAASTAYRGKPVETLTDVQLVEELLSAAEGYGVELNRTAFLIAARPEPAYVLTSSSTTFSGSATATYNGYVMPSGYGASIYGTSAAQVSGTATTRYQYTDVNAGARVGNAIAQLISQSRRRAYRQRGLEVLEEYERRVTARRLETESIIREFFEQHPNLESRRMLVAAVAPWAAAEGYIDGRETLSRTSEIIATLPRGEGLTGSWYGALAQTNTLGTGEVFALSEFVRLDLEQDGQNLTGTGLLGSGEVIEFTGEVTGPDITAAVANTTSGINVRLTAVATRSQITGEYSGFGAGQRLEGTFTLLR